METDNVKAPRMTMDDIRAVSICNRCKKKTRIFFMSRSRSMVCEECKNEENDPTAEIQLYYTYEDNILYCPIQKKYLSVDIVDLQQCGWFVRKRITYDIPRVGIFGGIYTIEYYGIYKCDLIPKSLQSIFPSHMLSCPKLMCRIKIN